jgi:DNA-binding Lrp family transcriptional regulator
MTYEYHALANLFPLMEGVEFDGLVADIKLNGLREPIVTYEGKILDGRNRYRACIELGAAPGLTEFSGDDPKAFVISANIRRRHLSAEDKGKIIADLLKADPSRSDRQIADIAKASPTTVGKRRARMEAAGDVSRLDTRRDTKGRKQPAKKKASKSVTKASRPARWDAAVSTAAEALRELREIQIEYDEWRDRLPENLQGSSLAEKLDVVCEIDIEGALALVEEFEGLDLPRGFGRD